MNAAGCVASNRCRYHRLLMDRVACLDQSASLARQVHRFYEPIAELQKRCASGPDRP